MPATSVLIRDLPPNERPRERLLEQGPRALSDAELLAILLRTGTPGVSVVGLALRVLKDSGGLAGLVDARPRDLRRKGLTPTKVCAVLAGVEMARRLAAEPLDLGRLLPSPAAVARHLHMTYANRYQEVFGALFLDSRQRLVDEQELFRGTTNRALVEPRRILQEALAAGATGVVVFHTHPSGDPTPSLEDLEFTRELAKGCEAVGLTLADHVIVGHGGRWVSLKQRGAW